jgi:hypothetical protein
MKWSDQLVNGRVFELRSKSKRYPAPCALVIDATASGWNRPIFAACDRAGVLGHGGYERRHNPDIYVPGIRREQFKSARVLRRRPDLERFDADDLDLIRYGCALDFSGRIHGRYSDMSLPCVVPSDWTVFWLEAFAPDDHRIYDFWHTPELMTLLRGAWHFNSHGGSRHLGYKFGHAWATRHTGTRLKDIRAFLKRGLPDIIEQQVKVARWTEGENVYTEEIRRECPALGSRACLVDTPRGHQGIYR